MRISLETNGEISCDIRTLIGKSPQHFLNYDPYGFIVLQSPMMWLLECKHMQSRHSWFKFGPPKCGVLPMVHQRGKTHN